jgi:nicotinate-nucleotide--dimethylbenzimidazole phosphoribosyltransferase
MDFVKLNGSILPPDEGAMANSLSRWNSIAKPIGSLGLLEEAVIKIAGLTGNADIKLEKRAVVVMCADNGVVEEGVTQTDSSVTAIVAGNIAKGDASVCHMAAVAGADVFPVDIGMLTRREGVLDLHIADGTKNMTKGPAMTREQAERAISVGIDTVEKCKNQGYDIIATGEMGIGNTTTSSALAAVLLGIPVSQITGRGAGLSDEGLERKTKAIERAIEENKPDRYDALDVLSKLGGFDIAGIAGLFIGGAIHRVPILVDGFISSVAALVAARLCPNSVCAMLAAHRSGERASQIILSEIGLSPLICAEMRLGEGTGAVCAIPLLDMALSVYGEMPSFDDIGIEAYVPMEEKKQ